MQFPIEWQHPRHVVSDDWKRGGCGSVFFGLSDHQEIRKSFADAGITEVSQHPVLAGSGSAHDNSKWRELIEVSEIESYFVENFLTSTGFGCVVCDCCRGDKM